MYKCTYSITLAVLFRCRYCYYSDFVIFVHFVELPFELFRFFYFTVSRTYTRTYVRRGGGDEQVFNPGPCTIFCIFMVAHNPLTCLFLTRASNYLHFFFGGFSIPFTQATRIVKAKYINQVTNSPAPPPPHSAPCRSVFIVRARARVYGLLKNARVFARRVHRDHATEHTRSRRENIVPRQSTYLHPVKYFCNPVRDRK